MPLWIVLPLCLTLALAALPVRAGFIKLPGRPARLGLALGPVRRQWSVSLAARGGRPMLRLSSASGERLIPLQRRGKRGDSTPTRRALAFLVKHFHTERLEAFIAVGGGDARSVVLRAALLETLLSALAAARPALPLKRRVACAFGQPGETRVMGIFSARVGHIMLAALLYVRELCIWRLRIWTSTPSKTS